MNKKIFVHNGVQYTIKIGVRNFLEFKQQYRTSNYYKRKRVYHGFNQSDDLSILYKIALKYINRVAKPIKSLEKPQNKLIEYLESNKYRYKPRTYQQFLGVINRFCLWCDKEKIEPEKISFKKTQLFVTQCSETKSMNTVFNIVLVLKAVYNGLVKEKIITYNPFLDLPKIKRAPVSLMFFNDTQIRAIKEYCLENNKQLWLSIQLLFSCFIRPAEMRMLTIYDVNLEHGFIEVKGEFSKNSKTQKVIIPAHLLPKLQLLNNYPGHYFVIGKSGYPSDTPVGENYFNRTHAKILKDLRIFGRFGFYSWKHTGVVMAVKSGINIKDLQLQLRHSSLAMVDEYLKNLGVIDSDDLRNNMPEL